MSRGYLRQDPESLTANQDRDNDAMMIHTMGSELNPLDSEGNYSTTSNNTKLIHWPLMGGLLHLVQREKAWAGCGHAQSLPRCTKCNSPPINGQCTHHYIAIYDGPLLCGF